MSVSLAVECDKFIQQVANTSLLRVSGFKGGDTVQIDCQPGLLLSDRSPNKTLTCLQSTGQWDYPPSELGNCASKYVRA